MTKTKALFILHYSPPIHGASKVGDYIRSSNLIKNKLTTKFVKIKSSQNIDEIGLISLLKIYFVVELFIKTSLNLLLFRPQIIYYTASPQGFAFYRDLVVVFPIKVYSGFTGARIFYHYHARGIQKFTAQSNLKRLLTNYFLKKVNLIFISELLKQEVVHLNSYASLLFLPNGVENKINESEFIDIVSKRKEQSAIKVLYLSNMIKDKGYDVVLDIAKQYTRESKRIQFDFAGAWACKEDENYFTEFVRSNNLEAHVTYHGLVQGDKKKKLFSEANLFIFPSSYKKEVFPLAVLEALSYGLPVLAFDVGAVTKIIHDKVGVISNKELIFEDLKNMISDYQSENKYVNCRQEYLNNYTIGVFEKNLLRILKSNNA